MNDDRDEEELLEAVALQNASSVFIARQRAEQELLRTREELHAKALQLTETVAAMRVMLAERDRARADAEEARHIAQEANAAKGRFLRMISHELRTPLGAIDGYAALLAEGIHGPISEKQRDAVARIRYNQKHLLQLVDELLDFAKIESGNLQVELTTVRVTDVLANLTPMIEPQISAKNQQLKIDVANSALAVRADPRCLDQIILNLLSNAMKFSDVGTSIEVAAAATGASVTVTVSDRGVGIPADKLEEVFESFYQVQPSLSTFGGTGLGLAISRQLAELMNGTLTAQSEVGRGSTFSLTLPQA